MTSNTSFNSLPDTDIDMDEQGNNSNSIFDHNTAAKRRLQDFSTQSSNSGKSDSEFSTTSTVNDKKMQIKKNKASKKERRASKKKKNETAKITYVTPGPVGKASTGGRSATQEIVPQRDSKANKPSCTTVGTNVAATVEDPNKKV